METYYFTFCHRDLSWDFIKIHGDFGSTRKKMFELFGDKWGFQYSQVEWNEVLGKCPQYKMLKELWA